MDIISKFITQALKFLQKFFQPVIKLLTPPKAFSWQTLIYLSVFSLFMSYFTVDMAREIISTFGWIFLIAGTAWSTTDHPTRFFGMPVGALITGGLVSIFAFGHDNREEITSNSFVLWPTISGLITAIPEFIDAGKRQLPRPEVRQRLIILVGSSMVISCWLQFFFVIQVWLREYPTLRADNFNRSAFVMTTDPQEQVPINGVKILDSVEPRVIQEIAGKPWGQVEKWLINPNPQDRVRTLGDQVIQEKLAPYDEKALWNVDAHVSNASPGYNLKILSVWNGPTYSTHRFFITKSCEIEPVYADTYAPAQLDSKQQSNIVAKIACKSVNQGLLNPARSHL